MHMYDNLLHKEKCALKMPGIFLFYLKIYGLKEHLNAIKQFKFMLNYYASYNIFFLALNPPETLRTESSDRGRERELKIL